MDAVDDLDFPKAHTMPLIPVAAGAPPPSSNALRRPPALPTSGGLKVPSKPGRYETEVDTTPLTPPSSSHNLQLVFDSSKVYENHPRKYRLLLETDKDSSGNSKNLSLSASSATDAAHTKPSPPPSVTVEEGQVVAMGTATSGPATGPSPTPDAAAAAPKSSATSAAGGAPFTLSEAISSVAVKKEPGGSRYVPQEFLHTFKAATTLGPTSDQKSKQRAGSSSSAEMPPSLGKPSSTGMVQRSNAQIPKTRTQERIDVPCGCAVVQPEPRRLFGFGPFYRPLPETICAAGAGRQSSPTVHVPSKLSEAVDREGITGAGYSGSRKSGAAVDSTDGGATGADGRKKISPTPAELNAWLGGSF